MTAGRGIVHSERTDPALRRTGGRLFGIQAWVALPQQAEETAPGFSHHAVEALPRLAGEGWHGRLIAGRFEGVAAPTPVFSPTLYADIGLNSGARLAVSPEHEQRAVYVVEGVVSLGGHALDPGVLYVLVPGQPITLAAGAESRLMLIGGAPMDGPRYVWWNFVSSSRERIEQAKDDWKAQRFAAVPGEHECIPLPEGP